MTAVNSFDTLSIVACSTKRASIAAGKRAAPSANLLGLFCTPLDPVDSELASRAGLSTPLEVWQTFIEGTPDIIAGDVLTVEGTDYPIRAVWDYSNWNGNRLDDASFKHLILEELKT
jgi:hypothetical protein